MSQKSDEPLIGPKPKRVYKKRVKPVIVEVADNTDPAPQKIHVNLTPVFAYNYNQISNHEFQLALCNNKYQILHTMFQCKDYFQDILWCEYNKKSEHVYGLKWEPGNLNINDDTFRLVLLYREESMEERAPFIQQLVNYFDAAQGFRPTKVLPTDDPSTIVVEFDSAWTKSGPLISAFTTIVRISGLYKGEDPIEYFKSMLSLTRSQFSWKVGKYSRVDSVRLPTTLPKLAALLAGKTVDLPWTSFPTANYAHSTGIYGYPNFPTVQDA
jgi:hypothetical protein